MQNPIIWLDMRALTLMALFVLSLLALATPAAARTLTVTSTQDGTGACVTNPDTTVTCPTLRAAVLFANQNGGSDIINLPAGTLALTVGNRGENAAQEGDLDITENLTINGSSNDATDTVIDAQQLDRVFQIMSGITLTLNDLTVKGGRAFGVDGGGIYISAGATATLDNVHVEGNTAEPQSGSGTGGNTGGAGGGIYNEGTLTMTDSELRNNTALAANGGGGLFNAAVATLTNTLIDGNQGGSVGGGGGGIHNSTRSGGSATANTTKLQLTNCTISNNIAAGGGGLRNQFGAATIVNSVFRDNRASSSGAAIDVSGGSVDIFRSAIHSNSVLTPDTSQPTGIGGGIANFGSLGMSQSVMYLNSAGQGGAIYSAAGSANLTNVTFTQNTALANGGGISTSRNLNMLNVTIFGNVAQTGTEFFLRRDTNSPASVQMRNTLVGNSSGAAPCAFDSLFGSGAVPRLEEIDAVMQTQGHNLETANTCFFNDATDLVNRDPLIDPTLQVNAAADTDLLTLALLPGSPAIDAGDNEMCSTIDQRSFQRRSTGDSCDIGAYEVSEVLSQTQTADLKVDMTASLFATGSGSNSGYQLQYAVTITNNGESNVPQTRIVITLPPDVALSSITGLPNGACDPATDNVVTCDLDNPLNAYSNLQFFILAIPQNAQVARTLLARVEVRATGTGAPADPNPINNFIETSTEMRAINQQVGTNEQQCGITNSCNSGGGGSWGWGGLLLGAPLLRRRRRAIH